MEEIIQQIRKLSSRKEVGKPISSTSAATRLSVEVNKLIDVLSNFPTDRPEYFTDSQTKRVNTQIGEIILSLANVCETLNITTLSLSSQVKGANIIEHQEESTQRLASTFSPENNATRSKALAAYIQSLNDFEFRKENEPYNHIGATLTDVMFQAGVNWHNSVEPRIKKIKTYKELATINGLQEYFKNHDAEIFFDWKGRKPKNFLNIVNYLDTQFVDTESDLRKWLLLPGSLDKLRDQPGFGNKTVDYIKIVVGLQSVAVDRHVITMLGRAGIHDVDYSEARNIVMGAADLLRVNPSILDHSIWYYISGQND